MSTATLGGVSAPATHGEHPVAELTGVARTYPGHPPVRALRAVDLRIDRGELVGIVGPSGSGKTTLLNVLGTLDRADAGTVRIDGHDVATLTDRQLSALRAHRIGFVFQQFFLAPGVSALDNVADGLTGPSRASSTSASAWTARLSRRRTPSCTPSASTPPTRPTHRLHLPRRRRWPR